VPQRDAAGPVTGPDEAAFAALSSSNAQQGASLSAEIAGWQMAPLAKMRYSNRSFYQRG
jgi:hypothetical protein